jgi:uncharacterized protein YbbC (DUF1343 family)
MSTHVSRFKEIMMAVLTGLEVLAQIPAGKIKGQRWGLLCNPASIDHRFCHAREVLQQAFPGRLRVLFSPQHGLFAEKQDNMIESQDRMDPMLGIPVFSLYGQTRVPTAKMLDGIDTLLIDLQDAGTRVYTFIYTMSYCLEAAKRHGKKVYILDRPNPLNGVSVEGNCLSSDCASFVGRYPIPMRHALTIGELALLFNQHFAIGADLDVIPMQGWQREMFFNDTGLPWVAPSPNLPTPVSAMVYPGQVLWEGTNLSEGRGTTQPFEIFGAPYLDPEAVLNHLAKSPPPGVFLRRVEFEPTSNKWHNTPCRGFQLHITDPSAFFPYRTSLQLLQAVMLLHRPDFQWKQPPYEYEHTRLPIDLLIGDENIRRQLEQGVDIEKLEAWWQKDLEAFIHLSKQFQLY